MLLTTQPRTTRSTAPLPPRELQARYQRGENITALLRAAGERSANDEHAIEVSYDLQAGSYVECLRNEANAAAQDAYGAEVAKTIRSLCRPASVLEAGVGEATTLSRVMENLHEPGTRFAGFDISWSRVAVAQRWLAERCLSKVLLCTGSLFQIPFAENSIDVVYTSHSMEPNGGREREIMCELYRIARRYLVLLEPAYELATPEGKQRMERHGYCRGIRQTCHELGFNLVEHRLFACQMSSVNPTALTIVEKPATSPPVAELLACPRYKTPLLRRGDVYFSPEALAVYPILAGIPCLRVENAIVASKWPEFTSE